MKDFIIGISLLWLLPFSIMFTRIIVKNIRLGVLKDFRNGILKGDNNEKNF